jgi:hypothetical protein
MDVLIPAAAAILFTWVLVVIMFSERPERNRDARTTDQPRRMI